MFDTVLKWSACVITIAAAICTANEIHSVNRELFALGSALNLIWCARIHQPSLVVINAALLIIYAIGLLK